MSDDQVGCEWVSVSSGTGLPWLSRTKAIKRVCVCVCVRACVRACVHACVRACVRARLLWRPALHFCISCDPDRADVLHCIGVYACEKWHKS